MIRVELTSSTYDNHLAVIILCVLQKYSNCDLYIIKRKKQSFKELLRKYNFMIYYWLIKNKLKVKYYIIDHKLRAESTAEAKHVKKILKKSPNGCFLVSLADIYGDHGIIGMVCTIPINNKFFFLDTFLMSCRFFG